MAYADLTATVWSETAYQVPYKSANALQFLNRQYEGELISRKGQVVRVGTYNPASLSIGNWAGTSINSGLPSHVDITVDQDRSTKYEFANKTQYQISTDEAYEASVAMGKALMREADQFVLLTVSGGTNHSVAAVSSFDTLMDARATLAAYDYTEELAFFATVTQFKNLLKDEDFQRSTAAGNSNFDFMRSARIGVLGGITVIEQSFNATRGMLISRPSVAFVSQAGMGIEVASTLGGSGALATRLAAFWLYGCDVIDGNGCLLTSNS